jgi:tetratricopeptide (TPR) repeat protein
MQQQPPRHRVAAIAHAPGLSSEKAPAEERLLETMLGALVRGALPADAWEKIHASALAEAKLGEWALSFDVVAQSKRLKAAPPSVVAEFLFQTGRFFADVVGDEPRAVTYFERALAASPGHASSLAGVDELLRKSRQLPRLAEIYATAAQHRTRTEQPALLRRAIELLITAGGTDERVVELSQQVLRVDPADENTIATLEALLVKAGRFRDIVRLKEQALASEPPPDAIAKRTLLGRVVELYADKLQEPERALPYVEQLLGLDPAHDGARRVAHELVSVRGLAGRAAAALAAAYEAIGSYREVGHFLSVELENTRGPRRAQLLGRLGRMKQERTGDLVGAFEAFEQALAIDSDRDVRDRYVALGLVLRRYPAAAKTLARVVGGSKDPDERARASAQLAEVLLRSGDARRATPILEAVLATPDAPRDAVLSAARLLRELLSDDKDARALCDVLERIAATETDAERRREADERICELAMRLKDLPRAIAAYERLLPTVSRAKALDALPALYEATGDWTQHARLLEERAKDAEDPLQARGLLMRAAEIRVRDASDPTAAITTCGAVIARFGAEDDVLSLLVPLLEARGLWVDLAEALAWQAALEDGPARAPLFARLGAVKLQRLRDVAGAIAAFETALAFDPHERMARATLEKLAAVGEHRLDAARVLEPVYRLEGERDPLLRMLDLRGSLAPRVDDRLGAWREAAELARTAGPTETSRAIDFVARGLAEAVTTARPLGEWLERLERLTDPRTDSTRRAAILAGAIGSREVDSAELGVLARSAAESLAASGDVPSAIMLLRRALAFEPHSNGLLVRIDELLREQGNASERIALYRVTLEHAGPGRRREILHRIGGIQRHDLGDVDAAIGTYLLALEHDPDDSDAYGALEELYTSAGRWAPLFDLLEARLARMSGDGSRDLRARLARLAAEHGDPERAREQCARLLEDRELSGEHLDAVQWTVDRLDAPDVARSLLVRRAEASADPGDAIVWLERLGELEADRRGDPNAAAAAWKRAAQISESNGDDDAARRLFARARKAAPQDMEVIARLAVLYEGAALWSELPSLYVTLGAFAADTSERVEWALRAASVVGERLGDVASAARHVRHAFDLAPARPDVLRMFEQLCVEAGTLDAFEQAIDEVLAHPERTPELDPDVRASLMLARARAIAIHQGRCDEAAGVYRAIVEDSRLGAELRSSAMSGLEGLVERERESSGRRADHEWLLEWRTLHAPEHERTRWLGEWAAVVETQFADPARALILQKRLLALDPDSDEALEAIARLALAADAPDEALSAMGTLRDRADGPARTSLDCAIADLLVTRTGRWQEALASLEPVLAEAPGDPDALAVAARALAHPAAHSSAVGLLERAADTTEDAAVEQQILRSLLDAPPELEDSSRRRGWIERLIELQYGSGRRADALATAIDAVRETPDEPALWDRTESLAREVGGAGADVAALYEEMLDRSAAGSQAVGLAERAVQFYQEWFEDSAPLVRVLERVLALDPAPEWAFDRLKLLLDAAERWDDLFALYDRALASAVGTTRAVTLLEEAAQTAKDFADRPERAIVYLEQLRQVRPTDIKVSGALERLYERQGRYRELVALLEEQLPALEGEAAHLSRARVATLWLDELCDPAAALNTVEPLIDAGATESTRQTALSAWALLERILEATSPASDRGSSTPAPGEPGDPRPGIVRQRAAVRLQGRYLETGRDGDLARILVVRLEGIHEPSERATYYVRAAELYERVGDAASSLEATGRAVVLAPADTALRAQMVDRAERAGQLETLATVLADAARAADDVTLRVSLWMHAATVRADRIADPGGAIDLLACILAEPDARAVDLMLAAHKVDPLLEAAGRRDDQLDVLERIASIEPDPDARRGLIGRAAGLAMRLGHRERARALWEARLAADERDAEALDGLVDLLETDEPSDQLAQVLQLRAAARTQSWLRREDLARAATLLGDVLDHPERAIEVWRAIESEFGEADDTSNAQSNLLRRTGRWHELAALLERRASRATDPALAADHWSHLGEIRREQLGAPSGAITAYASALAASETNARARAGLLAMTDDPAQGPSVIPVLLETLRRSDDWRAILALTRKRVAIATSPIDQVAILLEAAALAEHRAHDITLAFEATAEAFSIAPDDALIQREIVRVAQAANAWPALVQAYRRAIENRAGESEALAAQLWAKVGMTLEVQMHDLEGAFDAYRRVVSLSGDGSAACLAVRTACALGRWETAAGIVIELGLSSNPGSRDALDALERAAADANAWDAAAHALASVALSASLPANAARDVQARLAEWHRDRRDDPEAAEAALQQALSYDPASAELLGVLAAMQRHHPGYPLVQTLRSLSQASGGDLPLLREAADVAVEALADRDLALGLTADVLELATSRWTDVARPVSESPDDYSGFAEWAIETMARLHEEAGDIPSMVTVLISGDKLSLSPEVRRVMRRRAASLILDHLGDAERAIELYLSILEEVPGDAEVAGRLASVYVAHGRRLDLLRLREQQIRTTSDVRERVALRMEAAALLQEFGDEGRAIETLRDSIADGPGDEATVERLAAALEKSKRFVELRDLLVGQAGAGRRSADYWYRAALVAAEHLREPAAAATYHEHVVALEPRGESFLALAGLAEDRGDFATAAVWLAKWRSGIAPEHRTEATLRLANALQLAGDVENAERWLQQSIAETPSAEALRARLATLYRSGEQWSKLAELVAQGATHAPDRGVRLARLLEAGHLFADQCADPERAVSVLRDATDLAPDDPAMKLALADVLVRAGQRDEARTILQSRIDAFGGRRPRERAPVHYQMARLELEAGNRSRALVEFDAAARVDPQNPEFLHRLANLARDDGQLERAEKSYRALLVVLRRPTGPGQPSIARSEVLLELSGIAARRGEVERASEILESAVEAAADSNFEQDRLENGLRGDAALALARSLGRVERYVDRMNAIADQAAATGNTRVAAALLARIGAAIEMDLGDDARAATLYERVMVLEPSSLVGLRALDRIYERLGNLEETARVLGMRIEVEIREGGPRAASEALYRLAALRLGSSHTLDEGAERLTAALAIDPQFDVAEAALRVALAIDATHARLLDLYERVGREPGRERALADALRLRAALPGSSVGTRREAFEVTARIGDVAAAESLLARFVDSGSGTAEDPAHVSWALSRLAHYREAAGDLRSALTLKTRAADAADPDSARRLRLEVARLAADRLGDLPLAAETYLDLHRGEPTDREAWEGLAGVYRRQDESAKLADLLGSVAEFIDDIGERGRLRLERVRLRQRLGADDADNATLLREILDEDPRQVEAAHMLAEILDRAGTHDELAALLARQIEVAKDRGDPASIVSLSLRLGELSERTDGMEARNVYYTGLDWDPRSRALLDALLRLLEKLNQPGERMEILERRLELEQGSGAEPMALELWAARTEAGDERAAELALAVGYRLFPRSTMLRDRLEDLYRQRNDLPNLAELFETDAGAREDVSERVSRLREAAAVWWTELRQARRAAGALGLARGSAPNDRTLLRDHVDMLVEAGDHASALRELDRAIETPEFDGSVDASSWLALRAAVRGASGDEAGALVDFEASFSIDPEVHAENLAAALERARSTAERDGDLVTVRAIQLRRAHVLPFAGDAEGARALLEALLTLDSGDREALRTLASLESALERWEPASAAWARLVDLEKEDAAVDAALSFAEACDRAGRPGDARGILERVLVEARTPNAIRPRLERIYEATGAWHELAGLALADARASTDPTERAGRLLHAGWLLLMRAGEPSGAIEPIEEALTLRPGDLDGVAILADAYTGAGRARDAVARLERVMAPYRGRRARELAAIHLRMAHAVHELGDGESESRSLAHALECDSQNGDIVSEVALRSIGIGQLDLATRALRAVTLLKTVAPISRGLAYQYLGEIARRQGEPRRALALLRRALTEDPALEGARTVIEAIERGF